MDQFFNGKSIFPLIFSLFAETLPIAMHTSNLWDEDLINGMSSISYHDNMADT
jgi:hypothetical protein